MNLMIHQGKKDEKAFNLNSGICLAFFISILMIKAYFDNVIDTMEEVLGIWQGLSTNEKI